MATEKMDRIPGSFDIFMVLQVFLNYIFIAVLAVIGAWLASYSESLFNQETPTALWIMVITCGLFTVIRTAFCGFSGFKWWNIHGRGVNRHELIRGIAVTVVLLLLSDVVLIILFPETEMLYMTIVIILAFGADITFLTFLGLATTVDCPATAMACEAMLMPFFLASFVAIFVAPVFPFIVFYAGHSLAKYISKKEKLRSGKESTGY